MNERKRIVRWLMIDVALILLLHWSLLHWFANQNIVAKLLAAGVHVSRTTLAIAVVFVLLRFFTYVLLPGFVLSRLVKLAFPLVNKMSDEKVVATKSHPAT